MRLNVYNTARFYAARCKHSLVIIRIRQAHTLTVNLIVVVALSVVLIL